MYIPRRIQKEVRELLEFIPCLGIIGPRQCGKSTLVKQLDWPEKLYLDLENREHLAQLGNPMLFFRFNQEKLICLDEVQRKPEIFTDIKSQIDQNEKPGQFLVLGSASPALLKQSGESLAGRIIYLELSGFLWTEIKDYVDFQIYLLRGGYPKSVLAPSDDLAMLWLQSYLKTFFERDLLDLSAGINAVQVQRLFSMLSHNHGQELNILKLSRSLDLAFNTIKNYIDTLIAAFQLIILPAYSKNTGKRLIKSPKIYIADTGILHALLNIRNVNQLLGHPVYGYSFEGLIIKNITQMFRGFTYSFYKTSHGAEVDLVMEGQGKCFAVEIKASSTPTLSRGFWNSIADLECDEAWVIAWVEQRSLLKENVFLTHLADFCNYLETDGYK